METLQRNAPEELILKLDKYYREQTVDRTQLNRKIGKLLLFAFEEFYSYNISFYGLISPLPVTSVRPQIWIMR